MSDRYSESDSYLEMIEFWFVFMAALAFIALVCGSSGSTTSNQDNTMVLGQTDQQLQAQQAKWLKEPITEVPKIGENVAEYPENWGYENYPRDPELEPIEIGFFVTSRPKSHPDKKVTYGRSVECKLVAKIDLGGVDYVPGSLKIVDADGNQSVVLAVKRRSGVKKQLTFQVSGYVGNYDPPPEAAPLAIWCDKPEGVIVLQNGAEVASIGKTAIPT